MTLAVGDRVIVINKGHECYGQIGVIVAACSCGEVISMVTGIAIWKVALDRERCLTEHSLRKVDDDDDPRKVVSWDDCEHGDFRASVAINRLEDIGRFIADVRVNCSQCGLPFQFLGLPLGLQFEGATMSIDGQEAHLAIAPVGKVMHPLEGFIGYDVKPS